MNFQRSDFRRIWASLLACVLMTSIGLTLVYLSTQAAHSAQNQYRDASAKLSEFDTKLRQVRAEEEEIKRKSVEFATLQTHGIVGDELRLDWVELIKEIRESYKLLDLKYEFSPQQTLPPPATSGYAFKSSPMHLQMKLLHEIDLVNFIRKLRREAHAFVRVNSCEVTRTLHAEENENTVDPALLSADCELEWITIQVSKGTA